MMDFVAGLELYKLCQLMWQTIRLMGSGLLLVGWLTFFTHRVYKGYIVWNVWKPSKYHSRNFPKLLEVCSRRSNQERAAWRKVLQVVCLCFWFQKCFCCCHSLWHKLWTVVFFWLNTIRYGKCVHFCVCALFCWASNLTLWEKTQPNHEIMVYTRGWITIDWSFDH